MDSRVGPYNLIRELGAGSSGAVWFARTDEGAEVAVKLAGAGATDEFRLLAELDHPGVPRLAGCGVQGGRFWISTAWIEGTPLEGGMPSQVDEEQFSAALAHTLLYLASCGVCHGDVHPGNLVAAPVGYAGRLVDFGLASDGEAAPAGRRGFMAPEVLAGGNRTLATDLYGLAVSLRERGGARSARVARFVGGALSPDAEVRIEAARELAAAHLRPACGPRRVCRERELTELVRRMNSNVAGVQAVLVIGESGMGKTELLERVRLEARARGWAVQSAAPGAGADQAIRWANGLKPLLVVVDDVEAQASRLVEAVRGIDRLGAAGIMVVASSSQRVSGWDWDVIELGRIEDRLVGGIVRQVAGVDRLDEGDLRRLGALSAGNPRHATAVARAVISGGGVDHRIGGWVLRPAAPIAVPADAAAAARPVVAELEAGPMRVLAAATLSNGAIARSSLAVAGASTMKDVESLEAAGLLRGEGSSAVPRDAAVGSAAVERLSAEERAEMHRRLGALSEEAGAPRWVVAWHWIRAGEAVRGVRDALAAASNLDSVGDIEGARRLLTAAHDLAEGNTAAQEQAEAMQLYLASKERAEEGTARKAEELALRAGNEKVRRSMASVVLSQWVRLRRWDEVDASVARMSPALGTWLEERAAFARLIRAGSAGEIPDFPKKSLCATSEEAAILAWLLRCRGEFRAAARISVRGVRLALRERGWRGLSSALESAASSLTAIGQRRRASRVLEWARAEAETFGRAALMSGLWMGQALVASAEGRVGRGLSALREYGRLAMLQRIPADTQAGVVCLEAILLRFAGKPHELLARIEGTEAQILPMHRCWLETPRVMALLDLGRTEEAMRAASAGIEGFRAMNDASGTAFLQALHAMALAAHGDREGWLAEAAKLPERVDADRVAQELCVWVKGEAALARGDRGEGVRLLATLPGVVDQHRLFGCELGARAAVACVRAGERVTAQALVAALEPAPDSPVVEVWTAVARAVLEERGISAMNHLEPVREFLPVAGLAARLSWYEAAIVAGRRCGRDEDAKSWERLRDRELHGKNRPAGMEAQVEMRSLAAQARYIRDVVRDINAERNVARLLDKVLDAAISISGAERGCLVLADGDRAEVRAVRPAGDAVGSTDAFSRTICDHVLRTGEPLLSGNAMSDGRLEGSSSIPRLQVHSVLCMPFRLMGRRLGTVYLDHRRKADAFDPAAVDAIQTLADLAAVAIENAQLFEENERQRDRLQERTKKLEKRLEEVDRQDRGDAEAGLKWKYPAIVGRGPAMMEMLRSLERAAEHAHPALIHGETGTGKELVARALHAHGPNRRGPFIAENCAAISPLLMESELFGHVKGAFSGATADHDGLFRAADGGVLLLDEIGELEPALQAKLLRVLEGGEVRPVGSDRSYQVKVRVLGATHRDLESLVATGKFRSDLYYRLAMFRIEVPALRDRREDIPAMVRRFLGRIREGLEMTPEALRMLMAFEWPGNVRQLEHAVSVMALGGVERVELEQVRDVLGRNLPREMKADENLREAIERFRVARVQAAIVACEGQLGPAARRLGMTYQGIRKIAAKHKLLALKGLSTGSNRSSKSRGKRR